MNVIKTLLFVILIFEQKAKSAGKQVKLIYEKDISEHCRRRVMPSIFLGREVIDANARIVQFSRLELPYSCYVSIRTESGSSIVMMLQVTSANAREACKASSQLLVYEMGETFGGYWGPMPETVYTQNPPQPKIYTLKTTRYPITTATEATEEEEEETIRTETAPSSSKRSSKAVTGDYVEVEVPLVNVSVHSIPGGAARLEPLDSGLIDTFDMHHDVTPIPGVSYDRSILPLVQFRLINQLPARRTDDSNGEVPEEPKYDLEIEENFTPDIRLTIPQFHPTSKKRQKQRYQSTRRLTFKKHRTLFHSQRQTYRRMMSETITRKINDFTKYSFPTTEVFTKETLKQTEDSWKVIDDLLKKLNKTNSETLKTTLFPNETKLLEIISNMDLNKSAYLSKNLFEDGRATFNVTNRPKTTKNNEAKLSTRIPTSLISSTTVKSTSKKPLTEEITVITSSTKLNEIAAAHTVVSTENIIDNDQTSERSNLITEGLPTAEQLTLPLSSTRILLEDTTKQTGDKTRKHSVSESEKQSSIFNEVTSTKSSSTESLADVTNKQNAIVTGSMVGHESWENLVQAAPEMAVFLNQTVADVIRGNISDDITDETTQETHKNETLLRKKRNIHSIAIENAHPHSVTTRKMIDTTTELTFNIADMQEFAQLVELQDDELHGRVALRHVHQFVGPPLFNLCDITDLTKPQVHLFNSSRIVLAPTNFSLDRMVIVLTAARALLSGELRCPKNMIECQVAGARVCLDSMVACDGVPNCGSYGDVYDEDRLMCGQSAALQYNVYLAAFTFLAVLLTVIYAVHYWLKRCVPQVADAFFVYSDGVENVLYLDSIMRSPHEISDDPKMTYHSHMYDDDIYEDIAPPRKNVCLRCLRKICCCCCRKNKKIKIDNMLTSGMDRPGSKKMYSFTELEIRKMAATVHDTAVQTGASLELRPLEQTKEKQNLPVGGRQTIRPATASYDFSLKSHLDSLLTLEEPLPEMHSDELNLLKFLKTEARTRRSNSINLQPDMVEAQTKSQPQKKPLQSQNGNDSPSERELQIHTYDRPGILEPGASLRRLDDYGQVSSSSSVSKHLRFDEVTTTIPADRYSDDDCDIKTTDSRRTVVLGEKNHRISRLLDTIAEADEQTSSTKEHRHFWGSSKLKKPKKKKHVSLR